MDQYIAYLDCHSGISGDMFLGAMLDAGFSFETLKEAVKSLPISGYDLQLERFEDKGIQGSRFSVNLHEKHQPTRHLSDIVSLMNASSLPQRVREITLSIFTRLAKAEARVHSSTVEEVHFHEVGAIDAIIDIVGAALAVETLGIAALYASPLPLSGGHVSTAHGLLPVPAPATLEILRQVSAPWRPTSVEGELVTPTGAAILATLARFEMPAMHIEQIGYGFGSKRFPWPNCLRVCLGRPVSALSFADEAPDTDWVTVLESNIDNMPGELLGGLMERLLSEGALDVSYLPLQMKKNRPAVMLTVICRVQDGDAMARLLLSETSTLGVRVQQVQRLKAQREQVTIDTPLGNIQVKVKRLGKRIISAAPEYEACRRIALERNMPLVEVYELARQAIQEAIIKE
ncbi:MAG TPA: nickel pincer cofactor biosynthesis protein LarC [Ktedonobacteraceae bacterium]|jgi:uncharacterized protein (TIGR00299 family) protein|nr:nickel pincer cofactor biosynthesis protein LarC [Ktedonobacteraceae bacterium]